MADNQTTVKPRHTVEVREMRDGEIGITIGKTEYVMPKAEATAFSRMISSVASAATKAVTTCPMESDHE
jgi:hypothetical protein